MFCRFCGKQIEDDSAFCSGCGAKIEKEEKVAEPSVVEEKKETEPFFFEEEKAQPIAPASNPRMEGFSRALRGAIFAFVAMVIYFIAAEIALFAYYDDEIMLAVFLEGGSIALSILAIVSGAKSIATFCRAKIKPIATLVLGIVSLAMGATFLLCEMIVFFALLAIL